MSGKKRVRFYSETDMTTGEMLARAEAILRDFDQSKVYADINDIIELYHIKLYIDKNLFLDSWTPSDRMQFKSIVDSSWRTVHNFMAEIDVENITDMIAAVEIEYYGSFWSIFDKCSVYKRISGEVFANLITDYNLEQITNHNGLTKYYNKAIGIICLQAVGQRKYYYLSM